MNPSETYLVAQVQSATPGGLIVMLYDGLLRFSHEAEENLAPPPQGNRAAAATSVQRATDILSELSSSLRPEYNPDLCVRLSNLYTFFTGELSRALRENDARPIAGITPLITQLRDAWQEADNTVTQERAAMAEATSG
jgi:flagellar secretion chaperone FliS